MTNPVSGARKKRTVLLCLYGAALVYFILKMAYFAFFAGGFPDQTAQVSYLIEMCRGPQLLPDFAKLPLYSIVGRTGMTRQMIADPTSVNYLGHPPLYYLLLSLTGPVRFLADGTAEVDFLKLYISNILLTAAGAVLSEVWAPESPMPVVDNLGDEFLDYVQDGDTITVHPDGSVDVAR